MDGSLLLIGIVPALLCVYFLPTYLAYQHTHPKRRWILALNLFGGATFVGWLACFIWAATYHRPGLD